MSKQKFEWNPAKGKLNLQKHNVSFDEAATVFDNLDFISVIDEEHSKAEERYITLGLSKRGRLLVVAHTDRNGKVHIFSARPATRKEAKFYAEAT